MVKPVASRIDRLVERIEALPGWLKPPAIGALFVLIVVGLRGARFAVPIAAVIILIKSPQPFVDLLLTLGIFIAAIVGGGVAGLSYSLVGRFIMRVPIVGPYVTGVVTLVPYLFVGMMINRAVDKTSLTAPVSDSELVGFGLACLFFGGILGYGLFSKLAELPSNTRRDKKSVTRRKKPRARQ